MKRYPVASSMTDNAFCDFSYKEPYCKVRNLHTKEYLKDKDKVGLLLYLNATLYDTVCKIAMTVSKKLVGEDICVWVQDSATDRRMPLLVSFALSDPENHGDPFTDNAYTDGTPSKSFAYDKRYVYDDGTRKSGPRRTDERYKTLGNRLRELRGKDGTQDLLSYTLWYAVLPEYLETFPKDVIEETTSLLYMGVLRKYWTMIPTTLKEGHDYVRQSSQKMSPSIREIRDSQGFLQKTDDTMNHIANVTASKHPFQVSFTESLLIYEIPGPSTSKDAILVNLLALFKGFKLTKDVPSVRLYTEEYLDSCSKIRKDSIASDPDTVPEGSFVTREMFGSWTKRTRLNDGFGQRFGKGIDIQNTVTFIVSSDTYDDYVRCILHLSGRVQVVFQKPPPTSHTATSERVEHLLQRCQETVIDVINGLKIYLPRQVNLLQIPLTPDFVRAEGSYIFPISDYKPRTLKTIFQNYFTDFAVIQSDKQMLHLCSKKVSDNKHADRFAFSMLTKLHYTDMKDAQIKEISHVLYDRGPLTGLQVFQAWTQAYETNGSLPRGEEGPIVSIQIKQRLDGISVKVLGIQDNESLKYLMTTLSFALTCYQWSIAKKDTPVACQSLFRDVKERKGIQKMYLDACADHSHPADSDSSGSESDSLEEEAEESDESDSEESDEGDLESEDSESGDYAALKKTFTQRGGTLPEDDSIFQNSRYFSQRLEARDPDLFVFKPKEGQPKYVGKCQQGHQPLVLTKAEIDQMNTHLIQEYPATHPAKHVDITDYYAIDGRDPSIVYMCPEYWDRKNQRAYTKKQMDAITKDEKSKITTNDIYSYSGHRDEKRFIFKRDNPHIYFIPGLHPSEYPHPCCRKNPLNYFDKKRKKNDVNVHVKDDTDKSYSWHKGTVLGPMSDKKTYQIDVDGLGKGDYHISRIAKYTEESKGLRRGYPLPVGSYGHVSDTLKNYFRMARDDPDLRKPHRNGWFRIGVPQDNEAIIHSLNALLRFTWGSGFGRPDALTSLVAMPGDKDKVKDKENAWKDLSKEQKKAVKVLGYDQDTWNATSSDDLVPRTLEEFKENIMSSVRVLNASTLLQGNFVTTFCSPSYESPGKTDTVGWDEEDLEVVTDGVKRFRLPWDALNVDDRLNVLDRLKGKEEDKVREVWDKHWDAERLKTYTLEDYLKDGHNNKFKTLSEFNDPAIKAHQKRQAVIAGFHIESAIQNFDRYLKDTSYSKSRDARILVSLLMELVQDPKNTICPPNKTVILLLQETDGHTRVTEPIQGFGDLTVTDEEMRYYLISHSRLATEPLAYSYSKNTKMYVQSSKDTIAPAKGLTYVIDPQERIYSGTLVAYGEHMMTLSLLGTKEDKSCEEHRCILYDQREVVNDILDILKKTIPPPPPYSLLTYDQAIPLLDDMGYKLFPHAGREYFYDTCGRLTHLLFSKKGGHHGVLPIVPFSRKQTKPYRTKVPKFLWSDTHAFFKEVDQAILGLSGTPGIRGSPNYAKGTLVINDNHKMTEYILPCGAVVPLLAEPLSPVLQKEIEEYGWEQVKHKDVKVILNEAVGPMALQAIRGSSATSIGNSEYGKLRDMYESEEQHQFREMSSLTLLLREDTDLSQEVIAILQNPVRLPIRKRQLLFDSLTKKLAEEAAKTAPPPGRASSKQTKTEPAEATESSYLKRFIERLMIQEGGVGEVTPFLTLKDIQRGVPDEYVFTQRQLLNEVHDIYFLRENPWKRPVTLYGVENDTPLRKRSLGTLDDAVSFRTKYPAELKALLGNVQIYTHLLPQDQGVSSVIDYASPDIGKETMFQEFFDNKREAEAEAKATKATEGTEGTESLVEGLSSHCLSPPFGLSVGFCLYTNRGEPDVNHFHADLDIDTDEATDTDAIHKIPIICLYQDTDPLSETPNQLENIVFPIRSPDKEPETRMSLSLGELLKKPKFKKLYERYRDSEKKKKKKNKKNKKKVS
jgi:hypothetical protein